LNQWNRSRRERAAEYDRRLADCKTLQPILDPSWSQAVYHLYIVRTPDREGLIEHLQQQAIGTGIHYPIPLHLQQAYAARGYGRGSFPAAEQIASEVLSLPMFPQMTSEQQARVVQAVLAFVPRPA
jgi:dTDP-4-amino-4,6-dideoxygalactose transaminase